MDFDFTPRAHDLSVEDPAKAEQALITATAKEIDVEKEAERLMLSMYSPASILVNKDLQILRFYGATFTYLQPASGKASLHLLKMIRDELIFELRSLIKQVRKEGKIVRKERAQLSEGNRLRDITIEVQPVRSIGDPYLLIVFLPFVEAAAPAAAKPKAGIRQDERDRRILSLERELRDARAHVRSITEDFEATREELQSANEEVLSSNEELQSINEELETSKEELQSTNEELITINDELQLRNSDLKESVDYARAIIETTREPLMVLGLDLRILTVNNAFSLMFGLSAEEVDGDYLYETAKGIFDLPGLRTSVEEAAKQAFRRCGRHDCKGQAYVCDAGQQSPGVDGQADHYRTGETGQDSAGDRGGDRAEERIIYKLDDRPYSRIRDSSSRHRASSCSLMLRNSSLVLSRSSL